MFPPLEPFASGLLAVDAETEIYWETSGNSQGKPAVHLHGGPGGGMKGGYRRRYDPEHYLVVGFEQRGCGRSRPLVTDHLASLERNTTQTLVADMEVLRRHLGLDRWQVMGISWGTTLALAYAQAHPDRVTEILLGAVSLTRPRDVAWITEGVGALFPRAWEAFEVASQRRPGQSVVDAYHALLTDSDDAVRAQAALDWAAWEDIHISLDPAWSPSPPAEDPARWQVMATLVTHYWRAAAFLPADALLTGMDRLHDVPGVIVHGRYDVSGPVGPAWELHRAWPGSRFVLIDDEGHGGPRMMQELSDATTRFLAEEHPRPAGVQREWITG